MPTPISPSDLNKTSFGVPQAQANPVAPVKPIPVAPVAPTQPNPVAPTQPNPAAPKQAFSTLQGTEIHSDMDDYIFQFFMGSVSVLGLFILFRIIQKSK